MVMNFKNVVIYRHAHHYQKHMPISQTETDTLKLLHIDLMMSQPLPSKKSFKKYTVVPGLGYKIS